MNHRCAHIDKNGQQCGFHLPENYPFPLCPWHLVEQKKDGSLAPVAIGVGIGAAAMLAAAVAPKVLEKFETIRQRNRDTSAAAAKEKGKIEEKDSRVIDFTEAIKRRKAASAKKRASNS